MIEGGLYLFKTLLQVNLKQVDFTVVVMRRKTGWIGKNDWFQGRKTMARVHSN